MSSHGSLRSSSLGNSDNGMVSFCNKIVANLIKNLIDSKGMGQPLLLLQGNR